jgi:hypothetical protein
MWHCVPSPSHDAVGADGSVVGPDETPIATYDHAACANHCAVTLDYVAAGTCQPGSGVDAVDRGNGSIDRRDVPYNFRRVSSNVFNVAGGRESRSIDLRDVPYSFRSDSRDLRDVPYNFRNHSGDRRNGPDNVRGNSSDLFHIAVDLANCSRDLFHVPVDREDGPSRHGGRR